MITISRSNAYFQDKEYRGYLIDGVQYFYLVDIVEPEDMLKVFLGLNKKEVKYITNDKEDKILIIDSLEKCDGLPPRNSILVSWNGLVKRLSYIGEVE